MHGGDEVQGLEVVSWQGLEFARWEGSVDEGDCVVRVLGDLLWLERTLGDLVVVKERELSSSAVMPSRFSRRGEGAREGQRALRWRAPREDDVDREPRGPRCALAVSYAVMNEG